MKACYSEVDNTQLLMELDSFLLNLNPGLNLLSNLSRLFCWVTNKEWIVYFFRLRLLSQPQKAL